ncbi:MAG: translation initiation factor IF-2 subunit beta [Candidatus Jordarchaeales archaeon]
MDEAEYEALLDRARSQFQKDVSERPRFEVPRAVITIDGKITTLRNFKEICERLNRDPQHLLRFLARELATAGNIEGTKAVFQGVFNEAAFNKIIERYVQGYVICRECGRPDTRLEKEKRIYYLVCEACGARFSVKHI